jgi:hypothetical protein
MLTPAPQQPTEYHVSVCGSTSTVSPPRPSESPTQTWPNSALGLSGGFSEVDAVNGGQPRIDPVERRRGRADDPHVPETDGQAVDAGRRREPGPHGHRSGRRVEPKQSIVVSATAKHPDGTKTGGDGFGAAAEDVVAPLAAR